MRCLAFLCLTAAVLAQAPTVNKEPELGLVHWERDFATAKLRAEKEHKPLFLLFQEIPGCDTCTGFGKHVLSDPLLVAAIEQCFVPTVVRNNVEGKEKLVLEQYQEPAWNNPVVRLLDSNGKDVIPRADGIWDQHGIAVRMIAALETTKQPVPGYLQIARDESDPRTEQAVFEMHCFWEGEAVLGAMPGVTATKAAFVGDAEVVEVTFLPAFVTRAKLTGLAQSRSCKPITPTKIQPAPASDQKHALAGTVYAAFHLTPMQRMKVHSALTLGADPNAWLMPAQIEAARSELAKSHAK
jgi:hypothetical protein